MLAGDYIHPADHLFEISRLGRAELCALHRPQAARHVVQFYDNDAFMVDRTACAIARSLVSGQPSVLVGTPSHLGGIEQRLLASGFDLEVLRRAGCYVMLDAAATLSQLLVGDWPDDKKFDEIIGMVVRKASTQSPDRFVFVFGEMVGLLCSSGQPAAAIRLEQLWNALAQSIRFSLWCTYPLQSFDDNPDLDLLMQICAEHSLMVPADTLA